jgi:hypothetical protein
LYARAIAALLALTVASVSAQQPAPVPAAARCDPVKGYGFICGVDRPEDLARLPGTRWLIASGFMNGAGLKLVDIDSHTMRFWYTGEPVQLRPDAAAYADCPSAPDRAVFNTRGLSLRAHGKGLYTLYAVNHGGRESIEIFSVDATQDVPSLAWTGCLLLPEGLVANSVVSLPDGTILTTILTRPGTTMADYVEGRVTGAVYEWKPGGKTFRLIPGTELAGNNGIEASRDGKKFYVVAFGARSIVEFSRADSSRPLRKALAPGFMPDNIHWDGDRLIAAGMQYDEPACGGTRKVIDGRAEDMYCHRGYTVAALDPETMTFSIVAYGEPNPAFTGVSTAVLIGRELWLGSFRADRVAYRLLPY